jgi:serine/threonine protein kinase
MDQGGEIKAFRSSGGIPTMRLVAAESADDRESKKLTAPFESALNQMIGTVLNQYQITARIGAGGMGEVFRARDTRLNREVAVKVLPKDFAVDADRLRRFEQEAMTLAALNHPNVLTIHDAGVHDGAPYLVSELLEGRTLREELGKGAVPVRKATEYALQITHGLAAAHGKGIIHRDLKPENIFVTKDGRVKVLDFGLAKLKGPSPGLQPFSPSENKGSGEVSSPESEAATLISTTVTGLVLGTPAYMSPEQVRGEAADHRSDLFALGVVLYEMLSGARAFRRDSAVASMNAVLSEEPPDLTAHNLDIPPALERIVRRCLEKQPQRRFQSADDLAFAIENAAGASSGALRSMAAGSRSPRFGLRELAPWAVAALCLAGLIFALLRGQSSSSAVASSAPVASVRKFDLTVPRSTHSELYPTISPDGQKLVFANSDGLWMRRLDRIAPPQLLAAGENISDPFWSPQSTEVAYFAGRRLYRIIISGGNPALIATTPAESAPGAAGGAWLGNRILFTTGGSALLEAPAQGGKIRTALPLGDGNWIFTMPALCRRSVAFCLSFMKWIFEWKRLQSWTPRGIEKCFWNCPEAHSGHLFLPRLIMSCLNGRMRAGEFGLFPFRWKSSSEQMNPSACQMSG